MSDPAAAPWKHAPGEPNRPHPGAGHPDPRSRHAAHRPRVLEIAHNPAYAPVCSERGAEASSSADVSILIIRILMRRWRVFRGSETDDCNSPVSAAIVRVDQCESCPGPST